MYNINLVQYTNGIQPEIHQNMAANASKEGRDIDFVIEDLQSLEAPIYECFLQKNVISDNYSIQLALQQIAVGSKFIELHEKDQTDELFSEKYSIENLMHSKDASSFTIATLSIDNTNDFHANSIEELTLKVSKQAWIISPSFERHNMSSDNKSLLNKELSLEITDATIKEMLIFNTLEIQNCDYMLCRQRFQECNVLSFELNDHNNINLRGIDHYQALSTSINKQIYNALKINHISNKNGIEISLYPAALGHIKIKCDIKNKIAINVYTEKMTTLSLLQQNAQELKEVLVKNLNENLSSDINFNMQSNENSKNQQDQQRRFNHVLAQDVESNNVEVFFLCDNLINFII